MGGADEHARRRLRQLEELGRLLEAGRHRLLDEHVPARLERRTRKRAVLVHARQDEHRVDAFGHDDIGRAIQVGLHVVARRCAPPLRVVDIVDGAHVDAAGRAQPLDHSPVRPREDAAAADHSEAHAHPGEAARRGSKRPSSRARRCRARARARGGRSTRPPRGTSTPRRAVCRPSRRPALGGRRPPARRRSSRPLPTAARRRLSAG